MSSNLSHSTTTTINFRKITINENVKKHIMALVYGNCIGDAIGLLTEFMSKREAEQTYGTSEERKDGLRYEYKKKDKHRRTWETGDWTDDSDQMILIMQMLNKFDKVDCIEFAKSLYLWANHGFLELGDKIGCGLGHTTYLVINDPKFFEYPIETAENVWKDSNMKFAPNGAVMRTSILGAFNFNERKKVEQNTLEICKVTHADFRCQISCCAVTATISLMLQKLNESPSITIDKETLKEILIQVEEEIQELFFNIAKETWTMEKIKGSWEEFKRYFNEIYLSELALYDSNSMGYTFKCMGAGFWALRQNDFEKALTAIVMEGGDADTNGAVAGALLGCKLGMNGLHKRWVNELAPKPREFLDKNLNEFMEKFFDISYLNNQLK